MILEARIQPSIRPSTPFARHTLVLLLTWAAAGGAHAAHPFITDDTGTQGTAHWQLEVNTDRTRFSDNGTTTRNQVGNATLTYGATDTLDVAVNLPYQYNRTDGQPTNKGLGDMAVQAKWRFYENEDGLSVGLKPIVTLPSGNENKGLGAGRSTASLNLLGQYQKDVWALIANGGLSYNDNKTGDRKNLWNASTALLFSPNEQWTVGADVGVSRNADPTSNHTLSYSLLGVQYHIGKNIDVDMGYRRNLHSGPTQHTVGAGFTGRW